VIFNYLHRISTEVFFYFTKIGLVYFHSTHLYRLILQVRFFQFLNRKKRRRCQNNTYEVVMLDDYFITFFFFIFYYWMEEKKKEKKKG
jgi:hypothetical protein